MSDDDKLPLWYEILVPTLVVVFVVAVILFGFVIT